MLTEEKVKQALGRVLVPEVGRSIMQLNLVRGIEIVDKEPKITLALTALSPNVMHSALLLFNSLV